MARVIIFCFLFFPIASLFASDAPSCSYGSEIQLCLTKVSEGLSHTIDDFLCPDTDNQDLLIHQVILDKKFQEVDTKADEFLSNLEQSRDQYFSQDQNFIDWIEAISETFSVWWTLWQEYYFLCNWSEEWAILPEVFACNPDPSHETIARYISPGQAQKNTCTQFAEYKLELYEDTAYNILRINKAQVSKDKKLEFQSEQRNRYLELLRRSFVNIKFLTTISNKWSSKTKNPY